jgi:4-amino-4-deoxy-L-arabinose transferase-like glycosyltransferase
VADGDAGQGLVPLLVRWRGRVGPWHLWLGALVALGLGIRLGYVVGWSSPARETGDAIYYHVGANLLADGRGFLHPVALAFAYREMPGADHPPAYIVYLAAASVAGFRSFFEHQVWSCILGAATVGVVGFAGRRIGGNRAGLIAAGLAAVLPTLWMPDGWVLSETMAIFATALVILAAYRCWDDARPRSALWLGAAIGLAALSRSELLALSPLIVLPLFWFRRASAPRPVLSVLVAVAATVAVIGPWVGYNLARFDDETVLLSNNLDRTMAASWCSDGFYGPIAGYKSYPCLYAATVGDTQAEQNAHAGDVWRAYARDHLGRVPAVVAARVGRLWGLFRPAQQVDLETALPGAPEVPPTWAAFVTTWILLALAPLGAWRLRRRGRPIFPLLAPIVAVSAGAALTFGQLRYRTPADPALVLLVAGLAATPRLTRSGAEPAEAAMPGVEPAPEPQVAPVAT